jgi:hypothetical protein
MNEKLLISRRAVLRGAGTAIALPYLNAMTPVFGATAKPAPKRMAFVFVPNGVHMQDWTPKAEGTSFELPATLEPLKNVKSDLLVMTGLTHDKARANGDGPGDHARSAASFLTGCQPRKTDGANIRAGVSVDQIAAGRIGRLTRFPSLEIGCDKGLNSGNCDSGYSCAYSANISWKSEAMPMAKEVSPRSLFERLFSSARGDPKRDRFRRSILDYVEEDAGDLRKILGTGDQRKLDEYLSSIREIELRIERAEKEPVPTVKAPAMNVPAGVPKDYAEHMRLLFDLLHLAFQTDSTRVATFMLANEGSNRAYPFIEVREGHHDLSHHGGDKDKHAKIAKINKFHMTQFAAWVEKLKATREADGSSLLDNSMIVYGSAISDGNRHNHDDLPALLVGKGGGTIKTGRHVKYPFNTPMCNLFLSMLDRMSSSVEALGDGTGRLANLS